MHKARPNEIRHVSINGGDTATVYQGPHRRKRIREAVATADVITIAHDSPGGTIESLERATRDTEDAFARSLAPTVRARM